MAIDLSTLSPKQLKKLIDDASREHKRKQKRAPIAAVRKKLTSMAMAEGYSLMELFGAQHGPRKRAESPAGKGQSTPRKSVTGTARKPHSSAGTKVAAKYRNPDNPAETWSGRGQHPKWMVKAMAGGKKREDFAI